MLRLFFSDVMLCSVVLPHPLTDKS